MLFMSLFLPEYVALVGGTWKQLFNKSLQRISTFGPPAIVPATLLIA